MACDAMRDASLRDLAALQGQWEQIGFEENGLHDPPGGQGTAGAITTVDGCRFRVHSADGALLLEGTFVLDAYVQPRAITWMDSIGADAGKCLSASYELNGDRFVFIAADAGAPRPSVFRTSAGQVMRTFVRRR